MKSTIKHISFESEGFTLRGILHLPQRLPAPFVVGCHGLFADKDSIKQKELAEACTDAGLAYLRFDHRGCGESDGELATDTTLDGRCKDLAGAVEALSRMPQTKGLAGLFGSSMGGAVVLCSASRWGEVPVVTVAAPIQSEPVLAAVRLSENANASNLPPSFYEHALSFDISRSVAGIKNVLLIHGTDDMVVPAEHASLLYDLIDEPKELIMVEGGDHRLNAESHRNIFVKRAVEWFTKFPGRQ